MVALMSEAAELEPNSRVLEVGTGSGYGAAVLSRIAGRVFTVERLERLADRARVRLRDLGHENVHVAHGDGTKGVPDEAPFDTIVVTAGGSAIPPALLEQLADGGRLIIPVGAETGDQQLVRIRRRGDDFVEEDLCAVRVVPLVEGQG